MTVDRHTGKVAWTPREGGWVEVVLSARSVYGAVSRQAWTICVRKAAGVRKAMPNPRYAAALRKKFSGARRVRFSWLLSGRWTGFQCRTTAPPGDRPRVALPLRK